MEICSIRWRSGIGWETIRDSEWSDGYTEIDHIVAVAGFTTRGNALDCCFPVKFLFQLNVMKLINPHILCYW